MDHLLQFTNSNYQKLYMGADCYQHALNEIIDQNQLGTIFLVSTNSLHNTEHYQRIKQTTEQCLVGEFYGSKAHTPEPTIQAAMQMIDSNINLNAIIAFGVATNVKIKPMFSPVLMLFLKIRCGMK